MKALVGVGAVVSVVLAVVLTEVYAIKHMHSLATPTHTAHVRPHAVDSADQAAIDVLTYVYAYSHYYEWAGVILKSNGKYIASVPETLYDGADSQVDADPDSYPNSLIVADYHDHPCLADAIPSVFSGTDLATMRELKIPGYVLDTCTGDIHYWSPGDAVDAPTMGVYEDLATGRVIGHIKVDGIVLR